MQHIVGFYAMHYNLCVFCDSGIFSLVKNIRVEDNRLVGADGAAVNVGIQNMEVRPSGLLEDPESSLPIMTAPWLEEVSIDDVLTSLASGGAAGKLARLTSIVVPIPGVYDAFTVHQVEHTWMNSCRAH